MQQSLLDFHKMMRIAGLYIAETPEKGRGVFTEHAIAAETVIEIAPVIVMTAADRILLDQTRLHDYIFEWEGGGCAMALGWVPIYNHARTSNAEYFMQFDEGNMFIKTARDIAAGEEITLNYNGDWNDDRDVWFEVR